MVRGMVAAADIAAAPTPLLYPTQSHFHRRWPSARTWASPSPPPVHRSWPGAACWSCLAARSRREAGCPLRAMHRDTFGQYVRAVTAYCTRALNWMDCRHDIVARLACKLIALQLILSRCNSMSCACSCHSTLRRNNGCVTAPRENPGTGCATLRDCERKGQVT